MRKTFTILGLVTVVVWLLLYYFVSELECAFDDRSTCGLPWPWDVRGSDLIFFVIAPTLVALGLFVAAWWTGRKQ